MTATNVVISVCLTGEHSLELDEFARASGCEAGFVRLLVDEGLLVPAAEQPTWRFGGEELARVRKIRRLQRDFEANLQSVAVMLDLMEEIEQLHARWQREGRAVHEAQRADGTPAATP